VYNLAGDQLINYASDVPPSTFFADMRASLNINAFVSGVLSSQADATTSSTVAVPQSLNQLTLGDLQNLKTPWGRVYLSLAQGWNYVGSFLMLKTKLSALLLSAALCAPAWAEEVHPQMTPIGYQQITATTLADATNLTLPTTYTATSAVFCVETAPVRWRDDGTAPTASVGMIAPFGQACWLYTGNLSAIQFIAASGSPVLDITYYR